MDIYNDNLAKLLARINGKPTWAITIGQTTSYSESNEYVDATPTWRAHEDCHKSQWKRDGWLKFVFRYFWQALTKGYENIDYEVEARAAKGE